MDIDVKNEFTIVNQELSSLRGNVDGLKSDVDGLSRFVRINNENINERFDRIESTMLTRAEFLEYMSNFEDILEEMRDYRTARLLSEKQMVELDDRPIMKKGFGF